jgi:hypothetical protein
MPSTTGKSLLAVVAGLVFVMVVTTVVDVLLHVVGVYPPAGQPMGDGLAVLATAYRVIISVAGAWLTARLAPDRPMRHALVLGWLGVLFGTVGVLVTWNLGLGPRWYAIGLVVLALPQCWLGGRLRERQLARP